MNALLRIQVQVAAREAQQQLRQLQSTINQVNRAGSSVGRGGFGSGVGANARSTGAQLTALGRLSQAVNGQMDRTNMGMIATGKNMQWVGRQINFNFTIPLLLAGRAAMNWALENERAFTRVQKVYGESGADNTVVLGKISKAIRLLSDYYGVTIADVTELTAQWAAAGATGTALAQVTKTSLDLSILGDYQSLSDIFTQLVTIQTAYKFSAGELNTAIALLNTTENMTAATLPDLVTGIAKAGASAELAGVNFQHLAAFMAVLTPATGSAANAGNALKTIFSRFAKPTDDFVQALKDMGIEFASTSFQMLNGSEKLELMATKFATLTDAQKSNIAVTASGRWQLNKFAEIMSSITDKAGTYQKVLDAIDKTRPGNADAETNSLAAANREIQTLLKSDPHKIQILTNSIKNLMIDAITPAIPLVAIILGYVRALFQWFGNLNPTVQKVAIAFLGLVISVGIAAQILGSFKLLFGTMIEFVVWVLTTLGVATTTAAAEAGVATAAVGAVATEVVATSAATAAAVTGAEAEMVAATAAAMTSHSAIIAAVSGVSVASVQAVAAAALASTEAIAGGVIAAEAEIAAATVVAETAISFGMIALIAAAIIAVVALIIIFRDKISKAMVSVAHLIGKGLSALPRLFGTILNGVLEIVVKFVKLIVRWLSYLSPFSKHSPSLVENVTAGVQAILDQYSRLEGIGSVFRSAAADLEVFTAATKAAVDAAKASDRADTKKSIVSVSPSAGPAVDSMFANIDSLQSMMAPLNDAINRQQLVVDDLKASYDLAAAAVDHFEASMKPLQKIVDDLATQMDTATTAIQDYASTNITGMRAASDAVFANEMAQKKLRLEILQLGDAGKSYDDIRAKLAALQGDIESTQATMTDLRQSGAGSDVLGVYQDQLRSLEAQKAGLGVAAQTGADLTKQLEDLQHQADIMDLQNSLNFDPLLRQIDQLANKIPELPFDQIIAGITTQQTNLDQLTASYNTNKAALDAQQVTLDAMTASRDALKQTYDDETAKLGTMRDAYSLFEDQVKQLTDALDAASSAAKTLTSGGGGGGGGGGGFEDLTGQFDPTQVTDDLNAAQQSIDEWLKKMQDSFAKINLNPFGFIKRGWNATKRFFAGIQADIGKWFRGVVDDIQKIPWGHLWDDLVGGIKKLPGLIWEGLGWVTQKFWDFSDWVTGILTDLGNDMWGLGGDIVQGLWEGIQWQWDQILSWLTDLWDGLVNSVKDFFGISSPSTVMKDIGLDIIGGMWNGLVEGAVAVWDWFTALPETILGYFFTALTWLKDKGKQILTGLWNGITAGAEAVWTFFIDLPDRIKGYFTTALTWLKDLGKNILQGLWDGITWIWENGPDTIKSWLSGLPDKIVGALGSIGSTLLETGKNLMGGMLDGIKSGWDTIANWWNSHIGGKGFDFTLPGFLGGGKVGIHVPTLPTFGPKLHQGGIVPGVPGKDVLAILQAGERIIPRHQVQNEQQVSTKTQYFAFSGDLSFPNITDPNDVDKFIQNLEILATSHGRS